MVNMNNYKEKNYYSLDICKWVLAIFVIAIHTHPLENYNSEIVQKIYDSIVTMAVPIFFTISGFLLFNKMEGDYSEFQNLCKIKIHIIKLLRLYCMWTLIYIPITIYDYINKGYSLIKSLLLFVRGFLFIGEHYYSWPLWYLLSSIISLFAIFILFKFLKQKKIRKIIFISVIVFVLAHIMTLLISINDKLPYAAKMFVKIFSLGFGGNGRLFIGMAYITMGMITANKQIKFNKYIIFILLLLSFFGHMFFPPILSSLCLLMVVFLTIQMLVIINFNKYKIWYILRKSSTVMYFTHMIFFFIYTLVRYKELPHYGMDSFLVSFICAQVLSIFILMLEKNKTFNWLKKIF